MVNSFPFAMPFPTSTMSQARSLFLMQGHQLSQHICTIFPYTVQTFWPPNSSPLLQVFCFHKPYYFWDTQYFSADVLIKQQECCFQTVLTIPAPFFPLFFLFFFSQGNPNFKMKNVSESLVRDISISYFLQFFLFYLVLSIVAGEALLIWIQF